MQTVIAETIQEYYGEFEAPDVIQYVQINIEIFNSGLPEIVSLFLSEFCFNFVIIKIIFAV